MRTARDVAPLAIVGRDQPADAAGHERLLEATSTPRMLRLPPTWAA